MDNIKNKRVLITGGASGLGYKFSEELLRNGAKSVAILDFNASVGEKSAATLENEFGRGRVIFLPCDVTNEERFKECFKEVVDAFGGLDILINNAGMLNDRLWEQSINLNVTALMRGTLLGLDYMGKHKGGKGGTIVNMGSIVGLSPISTSVVYSATKHAVVAFSRCVQDFYDKTGVRILVMCPGVTTTALLDNIVEKTLDFVEPAKIQEQLGALPQQETEDVARSMMQLIQKGENGAIWVSEGGQPPYAVELPHYSKLAVPI